VDINPAARRLFGLHAGNEVGKPASAILPAEIYALETEGQAEIHLESGDVKQIEVRVTNLLEVSGEMTGKLILLYDVTSRQSAEQKLREANDRLQAHVIEIQGLKEKLREESIRDPLTGLYNRRYLDEMLSREISRSNRQQKPLSFMLLDMDDFKRINDVYGHQSGDIVLKELAGLITQHTRHEDIACRFGGDEFIIILPGTNLATAVVRAETLRREFATKKNQMRGEMITITFSLGVASYPDHGITIDAVIRACDEALYKAKANGTNRVEAYGP
jgi:diguanylate cyclase (GGDEF)-like protein